MKRIVVVCFTFLCAGLVLATAAYAAPQEYGLAVQSDQPLLHFSFSEPPSLSPTASVSNLGSIGGTATVSPLGVVIGAPVLSAPDFAALFGIDGVDSGRISVPYHPALDVSHLTLEAVVAWHGPHPVSPGQSPQRILERSLNSNGQLSLYNLLIYAETGLIRSEVRIATQECSVNSTTPLTLGRSTHIAVTMDGAVLRLYLNGVLHQSVPCVGTVLTGTPQGMGIGNQIERIRPFFGTIDDLAIYGSALASETIATHVNTLQSDCAVVQSCTACICAAQPSCCLNEFDSECVAFSTTTCLKNCACTMPDCSDPVADVSDDGIVSVLDVQCAILVTLWQLSGSPGSIPACVPLSTADADANCDKDVNIADVLFIIGGALSTPISSSLDVDQDGCPDTCQAGAGSSQLVVTPVVLPDGATNEPYLTQLLTLNNAVGVAWYVLSGSVPPGLNVSSTGVVSGIPMLPGTYSFEVWAVGDNASSAPTLISIYVTGCVGLTDGSLTNCTATTDCPNDEFCGLNQKCIHLPTLSCECLPPGVFCAVSGEMGDMVVCPIRMVRNEDSSPAPVAAQFKITFDHTVLQVTKLQDETCFSPEMCFVLETPPNTISTGHTVTLFPKTASTWTGTGGVLLANISDPNAVINNVYQNNGEGVGDSEFIEVVVQLLTDIPPATPQYLSIQNILGSDNTAKPMSGVVEKCVIVMTPTDCSLAPGSCDDGNACTTDGCSTSSGECTHVSITCDDGNVCNGIETCDISAGCVEEMPLDCNDLNVCTTDSCSPQVGCEHAPNTLDCSDNNLCTLNDQCVNGMCVGGTAPNCNDDNVCTTDICVPTVGCVNTSNLAPGSCDDGNACTTDGCSPSSGECTHVSITCDDENVCNGIETCGMSTGCVQGMPLDCNDLNVCTTDSCSPRVGCKHAPNTLGCSDNNLCTLNDQCVNGMCVGGTALNCNDDNVCTTDTCVPEAGCVNTPNQNVCFDGNPCTTDDYCFQGMCLSGEPTPGLCNNSNHCTTNDTCVMGKCVGLSNLPPGVFCAVSGEMGDTVVCPIRMARNEDSALAPVAAQFKITFDHTALQVTMLQDETCFSPDMCFVLETPPNAVSTGHTVTLFPKTASTWTGTGGVLLANITDPDAVINNAYQNDGEVVGDSEFIEVMVQLLTDIPPATPHYLSIQNILGSDNTAKPMSGVVEKCVIVMTPTDCNLTPGTCDDGNACTADGCSTSSGECTHVSITCDDGNVCNGIETCDMSTGCVGGTPLDCNDLNVCTTDSCSPQVGCEHAPNTLGCSDNNLCTLNDQCVNGMCVGGTAPNCNDDNVCTTDTCVPTVGCVNTSNLASGACDDGNACTTDGCSTSSGECTHVSITCDDGNVCNGIETCDMSTGCVGGTPLDCNDLNVCTTDSCSPQVGCEHAPNILGCSDNNLCTLNDQCVNGVCVSGTASNCNDDNVCTTDTCVPTVGCVNTPNLASGACDDGNACTADGCSTSSGECTHVSITCDDGNVCNGIETCDMSTGCVGGTPLDCNDQKVCTTDSCSPQVGCEHAPNTLVCSDNNLCTLNDQCVNGMCVGGTTLNCNDDNICTTDYCLASTGCVNKPKKSATACSDGNPCTTKDFCFQGTCVGGTLTTGGSCNDGNPCTSNDICVIGKCVGSVKTTCTDGNPCTGDHCDPAIGCTFPNQAVPCNDGDPTTFADHCENGECGGISACRAEGSCFSDHSGKGCSVESCCNSVCDQDPFCCQTTWDNLCVAQAEDICNALETPTFHPECVGNAKSCYNAHTGGGCNDVSCCDRVCDEDLFCCVIAWDAVCAAQAIVGCSCFYPKDTKGCSDTDCRDMVCDELPTCCSSAWNESCVEKATELCGSPHCSPVTLVEVNICPKTCFESPFGDFCVPLPGCEPKYVPMPKGGGPNQSCFAAHDSPGCPLQPCCNTICSIDPSCCDTLWDADCAEMAMAACGFDTCPGKGSCFITHNSKGCSDETICNDVCASVPNCCGVAWTNGCASKASYWGAPQCPGAGDCFDAESASDPGCSSQRCCDTVCQIDSFCCEVNWDSDCVEKAETYCVHPACSAGSTQSCFIAHADQLFGAANGCQNKTCCNRVCAMDPWCCDFGWDNTCTDLAVEECGIDECPSDHSCFSPDDPLDFAESPGCMGIKCCNAVCEKMPTCCADAWTSACSDLAQTLCTHPQCPSAGSCYALHSGEGCNDNVCCQDVCADNPYCCDTAWDSSCIELAYLYCDTPCTPNAGSCTTGHATPGCSLAPCCALVCSEDPFCCNTAWDNICVNNANVACCFPQCDGKECGPDGCGGECGFCSWNEFCFSLAGTCNEIVEEVYDSGCEIVESSDPNVNGVRCKGSASFCGDVAPRYIQKKIDSGGSAKFEVTFQWCPHGSMDDPACVPGTWRSKRQEDQANVVIHAYSGTTLLKTYPISTLGSVMTKLPTGEQFQYGGVFAVPASASGQAVTGLKVWVNAGEEPLPIAP